MIAVVLCAGYATRLRPLTDVVPKPLLPIAGRPILDHLSDAIDCVDEVRTIHVVTNDRFHPDFRRWSERRRGSKPVVVWNDGTRSNAERLGAIGDLALVLERAANEDDVLVVAGDNLFDLDLRELVAFWRRRADSSAIAVRRCPDPELVRRYSVVEMDGDGRVVAFTEKPADPRSDRVGVGLYVYCARDASAVRDYLADGGNADSPGNYVAWLHRRADVYGFEMGGDWLDIGDHQQLLEADNRWRVKRGLQSRRRYSAT